MDQLNTTSKIKHIFIDGREANTLQRVGSNVYAFEILTNLYELWKDTSEWIVTVGMTQQPVADMPKSHERWQYKIIKPTPFWTQWGLPLHLFLHRKEYQLIFTPSHYAPRISPIPSIITIFDLAFLAFPHQFKKRDYLQLKHWTAYSAKNAEKIITISDFSKQTIVDAYKKNQNDVVVAYPATNTRILVDLEVSDQKKLLKKIGIKNPYILYLGTIQPRKNIEQMIESFEQIKRQIGARSLKISAKTSAQLDDLTFVIAGKVGWLAQPILDRVAQSPFKDSIALVGFVDEKTKWSLLANATVSFQLGSHEGFGIPALEALAASSTVITHNTASLPEVIGQAGILVNSISARSLNVALKKVLSMTATQRAKNRKLAKDQVATFSWKKSARIISNTIESVIQK